MADPPLWLNLIDGASKAIGTGAILLAGWVGWVRYLRGRISHAQCDLLVEAKLVSGIQGYEALQVVLSCQNTGTCLLDLTSHTNQQLQISGVVKSSWKTALAERRPADWVIFHVENEVLTAGGRPITERERQLEPGERVRRTTLVLLPREPKMVAFRVGLVVEAIPGPRRLRGHPPWSTETVVVREAENGG